MVFAVVTLVLMAVPFVWLGLWILKGNGFSIISLPDKAKDKWDERALCRLVGGFMLYLAFCFLLIGAGFLSGLSKSMDVGVLLILGGSTIAIIKCFCPAKHKKEDCKTITQMENIDWKELGFGYMRTDWNARSSWKNGQWSPLEFTRDENVTIHMASTCLHYGQEAFEGLKAFRGVDGKVRIFRLEENAGRMIRTADYTMMAPPTMELFREACVETVRRNERFIPPYGTGASLYIRPLLIGTGAQVGVKPASEYMFVVFVTPVGPYYKTGFRPISIMVDRHHDRSAPLGTGFVKVGGNYAASLLSGDLAHKAGYPGVLYLDAKEKKFIDESGAANFFAIRDGVYITPKSPSILPSITNLSLRQLAADFGLKVEQREVAFAELSTFEEAGSCGTAAVISPIGKIYDPDEEKTYTFGDGVEPGPWSVKLYEALRAIQLGEREDTHGWNTII